MRDRHPWTEPKPLLCRVSPAAPAQPGGWGAGARGESRRVWDESQGREGSLAVRSPSLSSKAGTPGRPWRPHSVPAGLWAASRLLVGPGDKEAGAQGLRFLLRTPGSRAWPLTLGLHGASQAAFGAGGAGLPAPCSRPRASPDSSQEPGRGGGAGRILGAWLSLGAEGSGEGGARVVGGPSGAQRLGAGLLPPGLPARSLPAFCPPSARGLPTGGPDGAPGQELRGPAEWPRE